MCAEKVFEVFCLGVVRLSTCIHSLDYSCHVTKHHSMHHRCKTHETNKHYQTQTRFKECYLIEREREMFYLMMHSTHFIYGYMASDIWLRTILILRKETRCHHIGYSYRLSYILWIIAVTLPNTTACIIAAKHTKQINIIEHKRG